jgi:hypothetical protein
MLVGMAVGDVGSPTTFIRKAGTSGGDDAHRPHLLATPRKLKEVCKCEKNEISN